MKKIIDYKIINISCETMLFGKTSDSSDIQEVVKEYLKRGWQPFGELKISVGTGGSFLGTTSYPIFTQVMVKYE